MNIDRLMALCGMHDGYWMEELLSEDFMTEFNKILSKTLRQVLELKIEGKSNRQIARLLGTDVKSVERRLFEIKQRYKHGMVDRVDNLQIIRDQKRGLSIPQTQKEYRKYLKNPDRWRQQHEARKKNNQPG